MAAYCRGAGRGRHAIQLHILRKCHHLNNSTRGKARPAAHKPRKSVFGAPGFGPVFACGVLLPGDACPSPCCHSAADRDVQSLLLGFAAPAGRQRFPRRGHQLRDAETGAAEGLVLAVVPGWPALQAAVAQVWCAYSRQCASVLHSVHGLRKALGCAAAAVVAERIFSETPV